MIGHNNLLDAAALNIIRSKTFFYIRKMFDKLHLPVPVPTRVVFLSREIFKIQLFTIRMMNSPPQAKNLADLSLQSHIFPYKNSISEGVFATKQSKTSKIFRLRPILVIL